jgi:hypothetical protein
VDEVALRHGACVEEETTDANVAYGGFPERVSTPTATTGSDQTTDSRAAADPLEPDV